MRNLYCELGAGCKTIARNCDSVMLKVCIKFSEATTDQRYLYIYMLMVGFLCVCFFFRSLDFKVCC